MPFYDFTNIETGESVRHYVKIADLDQFKEDNPHLKQDVSAPLVSYSPTASGKNKPPGWFRDKMSALNKNHKHNKLQTW